MTTQMTDQQTSQHNMILTIKDLETIKATLASMTKTDIALVAGALEATLDAAREAFRSAIELCACGNWPAYCTCQQTPAPVAEPQNIKVDTGTTQNETISDGTYTVEFGDGTYRTLRIKTQAPDATWMPGKRIASFLNGPDNWSNYKGFAFVNDDNTFRVWSRFAHAHQIIDALGVICSGREAMVNGLTAYGMASGKCGICGRKLTTPESIKRGIGPDCAARLGI